MGARYAVQTVRQVLWSWAKFHLMARDLWCFSGYGKAPSIQATYDIVTIIYSALEFIP